MLSSLTSTCVDTTDISLCRYDDTTDISLCSRYDDTTDNSLCSRYVAAR
jgi:hypothetical protein